MKLDEFKAWFEGFTENIDKQPTQKQWARIKARVAEIDGQPVTERIYVDRYLPYVRPYAPYWSGELTWSSTCQAAPGGVGFNSNMAMAGLGRAEALEAA